MIKIITFYESYIDAADENHPSLFTQRKALVTDKLSIGMMYCYTTSYDSKYFLSRHRIRRDIRIELYKFANTKGIIMFLR